ncbi:MAG: triose-phosphate isomerase [Candidatus Pacebacteria bacterium]|nr:triose-phosphate isomerase [Candidatus Paceibacterota bacterium]MDR3583577.1 triose-phosphate isomerase [Candidatus Paceibacterota bacterium]
MEKLVVANLKMNLLSLVEREQYLKAFKKEIKGKKMSKAGMVLCPPFVHLEAFQKARLGETALGAQDMFWERSGSFTGEISPAMLKNFGCEFVVVGHSERRRYFSESDEEVKMKIAAAFKIGLKPILCVGETRVERNSGQAARVIGRQVKSALIDLSRAKAENLTIAYEPVWAIGADVTPTAHEIMEVKVLVRKILVEIFGKKYANMVKIIYGGNVTPQTTKETCLEPGLDGALVGRASLAPHEFIKIVEIINNN